MKWSLSDGNALTRAGLNGSPESFDTLRVSRWCRPCDLYSHEQQNRHFSSRCPEIIHPRPARAGGGIAGRVGIRAGYPGNRNAARAVDPRDLTKACRGSSSCEARRQLLWRPSSRFRAVVGTVIVIAVFVRLLVAFFEWRRRFRGRGSQWSGREDAAECSRDCRGRVMVPRRYHELQDSRESIVTGSESGTEAAERRESRVRDRVTSQAPPVLWMSTGAAGR